MSVFPYTVYRTDLVHPTESTWRAISRTGKVSQRKHLARQLIGSSEALLEAPSRPRLHLVDVVSQSLVAKPASGASLDTATPSEGGTVQVTLDQDSRILVRDRAGGEVVHNASHAAGVVPIVFADAGTYDLIVRASPYYADLSLEIVVG